VTFTYKLYEAVDSLDALNGTGTEEVSSQALASISFATGQDVSGSFSATNLTALVAEQFRKFDDGADADTAADSITAIGSVEYAVQVDVLAADDSSAVAIADVYTVSSDATLTGDFSFGTWTLNPEDDCSGVPTALTVDEDELGATTDAAADFTEQYLCIDASAIVSPDVIPKVTTAYSVSLDDNDGVSGSLGTISYDTTSILVPFITTFADNNHKFYIVNSGGTPASFSTTFATEDGTDYAVLDGSRGEVPAGGMVQLKAESMVEFTGETTRGSATIEIEAEASSIQATSQLTNRVNKGSDLTILTVQ
jgi:hypothetical protein